MICTPKTDSHGASLAGCYETLMPGLFKTIDGTRLFLGYTCYSLNLAYCISERQKPWCLTQVSVILRLHSYPLDISVTLSLTERVCRNTLYPCVASSFPYQWGWRLAYQFSCNFSQHLRPKQVTGKSGTGTDPSQTSSVFSNTGTRWVRKEARHVEKCSDQRRAVKQKIRTLPGCLAQISCTYRLLLWQWKVSWFT